ncbi:MAG: hypothetical protein HWN68_02355 [Desulfobacterales bacterium]|nr:hypothetical protein [Desulfobacterales bacterium]
MESDYEEVKVKEKTAKDFIDDLNLGLNLDEKMQTAAGECIAFGNSFWWKPEGKLDDLEILPLTAVEKIFRNERGKFEKTKETTAAKINDKLGYKLTTAYGGNIIPPDHMIHFRWHPVNNEAFGSGVMRKLCAPMDVGDGEQRKAFFQIKGRIINASDQILEKSAASNELWNFPGKDDEDVKAWAKLIKKLPKKGARFTTNVEGANVLSIVPEVLRGWNQVVELILGEYILGLGSPVAKAMTTPGYTEASIKGAIELHEKMLIMPLQRFLKRRIEENLWTPSLKTGGFEPIKAGVRLNWGFEEKLEVETMEVIHAWETGLIRTGEARTILIEAGGWPLEKLEERVPVGPAGVLSDTEWDVIHRVIRESVLRNVRRKQADARLG